MFFPVFLSRHVDHRKNLESQRKITEKCTIFFPTRHPTSQGKPHKGTCKIYEKPGPGLQTGGHRLFLREKKGGEDLFGVKKKGAKIFFGRKKRGQGLFLKEKKGG